MRDYCAFTKNQKCSLWLDYEVTRTELEELHELCHGNWIKIERLRRWTDELTHILGEHGIHYPVNGISTTIPATAGLNDTPPQIPVIWR